MTLVDPRSPELAYSTKNNILRDASAAIVAGEVKLAASRAADSANLGQDGVSVTNGQITLTKNIKR